MSKKNLKLNKSLEIRLTKSSITNSVSDFDQTVVETEWKLHKLSLNFQVYRSFNVILLSVSRN